MKKISLILVLLVNILISSTAFASRGIVSHINDSCDKILIHTNMGYTCAEVWSGYFGYVGNVIVGDFESYGTKDLYDVSRDISFSAWIDNYWLDKAEALEWLYS